MTRVHVGSVVATGLLTEVRAGLVRGGPCVLKLPRTEVGQAGLVRIEDEAFVLSRARGAHLVEGLGIIEWRGRRGLVIRHAGSPLQDLAGEVDRFSEVAIAAVGAQLAAALSSCHAATTEGGEPLDLVHRDVAPQNVFVDAEGQVRLADFGNAWFRERRAETQVGRVFGTEGFMAPEHRAGALPTSWVDVYAIACVLGWLRAPRQVPLEADPTWAGPVGDWVNWARRSAAEERPSGSEELAQACQQVLDGRTPQSVLRGLAGPAPEFETTVSVTLEPLPAASETGGAAAPALDLFMGAGPPPGYRTRVAAPIAGAPMPEAPAPDDPTRIDRPDDGRTQVADGAELSAAPTRIQPSTLEAPVGLANAQTATEAAAPRIGDELHGFRLERVLGEGQWGRVYAARHTILGNEVAVKVLHAPMVSRPTAVQRFFQEAQTLSRVEHPNIVRVSTCGHSPGGTPFLVMELLAGPSMKAALRSQLPLPPEEAAPLLREIAVGLMAAHEAGLVHRDLKPTNILMTQGLVPPRLKIVDFGVAHFSHADNPITRTHELLGSPAYMSPEQIRMSRAVDPRADLYSLGVITFWMLTGRKPFPGASRYEVMKAHLEDPVPPVEPAGGLDELVQSMLQKDPDARPASAAEVVRQLDEFLRPVGTTVLVSPAQKRTPRWGVPAAALALASVAGLAALWATRGERPPPPRPAPVEVAAAPRPPSATAAPIVGVPAVEVRPAPAEAPPSAEARLEPGRARPSRPVRAAPPVRRQTARELARRYGLPARDLRALAPKLLEAYARARTPERLASLEAELARAAADASRLEGLVRTRIRAAKEGLRRVAGRLSAHALAKMESSLLDVQERAVRANAPSQYRALLIELARLEGDLRAHSSQ